MNELTQQGIAALKSGDRAAARQLLTAAIKQDPKDELAWLWLTGALDKDEERIACLRQVLKLNPGNQVAARGLAQIMEHRAARPEPAPAEAAPAAEPVRAAPPPEPERPAVSAAEAWQQMREPFQENALEEAPAAYPDDEAAAPGMAAAAEPAAVEQPAAPARRAPRRAAHPAVDANAKVIFRSRPSLVPALICFWLFLIGALVVASLLRDVPDVGLPLAGGLGFILEVVVLYAIIRTMSVRYELTSQQLTLRFKGKRARIPVTDIYNADLTHSFVQRLLGIGTVNIDAAVDGQLAHLQLRNIPQSRLRAEQIMYLVRDNAAP